MSVEKVHIELFNGLYLALRWFNAPAEVNLQVKFKITLTGLISEFKLLIE